jgi:hypothetical protein
VARVNGVPERVARALRDIPIGDVMTYLARLTEHDRYQASLGIERAAELIASAAEAIGLAGVTVERFPADGATRWWTFQAPRAWTPTAARLEIRAGECVVVAVDHAAQPFTIATYSAPARTVARVASLRGDVAGAVVVVDPADYARPELVATLAARGALGFVTDGPCRDGLPGRIELDARTSLFGFSVTAAQRLAIGEAVDAAAHVVVDVDRSARMPVVTGVLPGRGAGEVWLTSHLCHPRPGANDNASGAAALLGVAATLRGRDLERSVRFVWGPEFLGVAALLHDRFERTGAGGRPVAVINLDMVGEDPARCGVPLVVERAPEWCPSIVTPVAEHVVDAVFAQTAEHAGTWRPGPFYGFSDHALFANFADAASRSPAVQLWHPGDPFNHSAADSLDKVSAIEVQRAVAAGAVIAELVAAGDHEPLAPVVRAWCEREARAAADVAQRYEPEHRAWSRRLVDHVREQAAALLAIAGAGPAACTAPRRARGAFAGRWPGPFNYRGLLGELATADRDAVMSLFVADKRNYAVLTHLAMLADGCVSRDETIDAASLALRYPIDAAVGGRLWSALLASGWLAELP